MVDRRVAHLTCSDGASALKKEGVALTTITLLPRGATTLHVRRATRGSAPHGALPRKTRAIRVNSLVQCGFPGTAWTTAARGFAL